MTMNIYRLVGDMSHLVGVLLLLRLAKKGRSAGVSLKAQELYLVVYCARYLDLVTTFYSFYNSLMKVIYIFITGLIVYILRSSKQWHTSYNPEHDSFPHWKFILLPSFLVALVVHGMGSGVSDFNVMELFWTLSICLESVAMIPQLIMFRSEKMIKGNQQGKDDILIPIFLFGIYRGFYILNWIYRAHHEKNIRHHYFVYLCGVIQVLLYSSFFHVCCKSNVCPSKKTQAEEEEELEIQPLMTVITNQGITSAVIGGVEEEENLGDIEEDSHQQNDDVESNEQVELVIGR